MSIRIIASSRAFVNAYISRLVDETSLPLAMVVESEVSSMKTEVAYAGQQTKLDNGWLVAAQV